MLCIWCVVCEKNNKGLFYFVDIAVKIFPACTNSEICNIFVICAVLRVLLGLADFAYVFFTAATILNIVFV